MSKAWNGADISPTLTTRNANGAQRMPDKDNFTCVLVETESIPDKDKCCFNCKHRIIRETSHEWIENFCPHTKGGNLLTPCKYWEWIKVRDE